MKDAKLEARIQLRRLFTALISGGDDGVSDQMESRGCVRRGEILDIF